MMDRRILYIGIDLGDKTTSMFYVNSGSSDMTNCIQLPGTTGNTPLESTVCILKTGKSILGNSIEYYELDELDNVYHNFKYQPDEVKKNNPAQYKDMQTGINSLIDCIFHSEEFNTIMMPLAGGKDEIVFCIGYPTNWTEESIAEYEGMIKAGVLGEYEKKGSYLGVPVRITFERESTGAYVYINCLNRETNQFRLKDNGNILVLDFGSSTVNITALGRDSREVLYTSGNNRFGGRQLDALITQDCISSFKKDKKQLFAELDRLNDRAATKLLVVAASHLKEGLSTKEQSREYFPYIQENLRFDRKRLYNLATNTPIKAAEKIAPGLISANENDSWAEIMKRYLSSEKEILERKGIRPEMIILTGGGASMPIVQDICRKIFGNIQTLDASESSTVISRGLALSAKNMDRSNEFNEAIALFIKHSMPRKINAELSTLISAISRDIADILCRELELELRWWKTGVTDTFNDVIDRIRQIDANDIIRNEKVGNSIRNWYQTRLYPGLDRELNNICQRFGARQFSLPKETTINLSSLALPSAGIVDAAIDAIMRVVSILTGVLAGLLALSGFGIPILAAAAGVAIPVLLIKGWESMKDIIIYNIREMSLPLPARMLLGEGKIMQIVHDNKPNIEEAVKRSLQTNTHFLAWPIKGMITDEIDDKIGEIRYELGL